MIRSFVFLLTLALALPAGAQSRDETLADIRQELSALYVEVLRLKQELNTTGLPTTSVGGNTPLERIDAIEQELQRLTAKTEELEFLINQLATRGGNQIGDLEFRLCELEDDCDYSALSEPGATLGNVDMNRTPIISTPLPEETVVELAVGERADFDRAKETLEAGDHAAAAEQFAAFVQNYPGSPLNAQAHYMRGDALEQSGQTHDAARAYLEAFSTAPSGPIAADALYKVGATMADLGLTDDACQMLGEVGNRFPGTEAAADAAYYMNEIGCI